VRDMPGNKSVDCIDIGAGRAGLAMSAGLRTRGISHVVLERVRMAERWRSRRPAQMLSAATNRSGQVNRARLRCSTKPGPVLPPPRWEHRPRSAIG
jgi:cation diffusion facilitator CzcD-associated flavoprotein CzcO